MIIGFTGKNAAGKGESCNHLVREHAFVYLSLSDELREEATREGIPHTREHLILLGTRLRQDKGVGYLASKVNEKISRLKAEGKRHFAIDSIRSPGEVEELRKNPEFMLIGIDADAKIRFERMQRRGRLGDAETFEKFLEHEKKENSKSASGQKLDETLALAKTLITNNGTLEELYRKIDAVAQVHNVK